MRPLKRILSQSAKLKKILSMKLRNAPSGPEKKIKTTSNKMKPYCSNIIMVSVLSEMTENKSFDPSSGGIGTRLKKAKMVFQKITTAHRV